MHDEKYIVFKRDEWQNFLEWLGEKDLTAKQAIGYLADFRHSKPLEDAVVIRTQDVFAAGGLSAYSHAIRAYLGGAQIYLPDEMMQRLLEVADYFASVAQEAEDRLIRGECKVPD